MDGAAVNTLRLADLTPGKSAVVTAISGAGRVASRLMEMGFVPGTIVEVLRHSDALSELFEQSRLGAAGFREGSRADDLAGTRVGDSEHYDATPFVGDGNAGK